MRILAAQIQIPATDTRASQQANIRSSLERLGAQLESHPVDLVLLPELSTMHYSTENFQHIDQFSEELYGESFELFSSFCRTHNVAVCYGLARREGADTYISHVALGRQGQYLTHYDKIHVAEYGDSSESRYFKRGNHLAPFEIDGVRAGIIICYDMRFPELTRLYCQKLDVDIILHPVAFAQDCSFHSWKQFVVSRALENQVFFMSLNRAGPHFGHSIICPPWIDDQVQPTVFGESEEFRIFDIDLGVANMVRQKIPFRRDALESYQVLPVRKSTSS